MPGMNLRSNKTPVEEVVPSNGNNEELLEDDLDSDRIHSSSYEDNEEIVYVDLLSLYKEVECPICLGVIRNTKAIMECLHRFCGECIEKYMRHYCNNECPMCRTQCASLHSLKDDPNYDSLIAALCPDIDEYEEVELALLQDEMTHYNKPGERPL